MGKEVLPFRDQGNAHVHFAVVAWVESQRVVDRGLEERYTLIIIILIFCSSQWQNKERLHVNRMEYR
mgnify:FL=1